MIYNNTRTIGNIGEAIALAEMTKRNIPVFTPFGQNTPVDLVIFIKGKFLKIQVKTTQKIKNGRMVFEISRTNGFTLERKPYSKEDTDYFFLYCIENENAYLVGIDEVLGQGMIVLRIESPKNNQMKGIKMAENYTWEKQVEKMLHDIS